MRHTEARPEGRCDSAVISAQSGLANAPRVQPQLVSRRVRAGGAGGGGEVCMHTVSSERRCARSGEYIHRVASSQIVALREDVHTTATKPVQRSEWRGSGRARGERDPRPRRGLVFACSQPSPIGLSGSVRCAARGGCDSYLYSCMRGQDGHPVFMPPRRHLCPKLPRHSHAHPSLPHPVSRRLLHAGVCPAAPSPSSLAARRRESAHTSRDANDTHLPLRLGWSL